MKNIAAGLMVLSLLLCGCGKRVSDNERLNTAVRQLRDAEVDKSIQQLEAVLKNNPDNCSARLLMALNLEKLGKRAEALDLASTAAAEEPDNFAALYTCGRLRMYFPVQWREAYQQLSNAQKINPDDISTLIALCNLGTELKYKNVLQYINLLKTKPGYEKNNILNYQLGQCLLQHGKRKEALEAFKSAVNGLSDFTVLFHIARAIDHNQLDRGYAVKLYRFYLMIPAKQRDAGAAAYAKSRISILGR